jgi:hypothetical protein
MIASLNKRWVIRVGFALLVAAGACGGDGGGDTGGNGGSSNGGSRAGTNGGAGKGGSAGSSSSGGSSGSTGGSGGSLSGQGGSGTAGSGTGGSGAAGAAGGATAGAGGGAGAGTAGGSAGATASADVCTKTADCKIQTIGDDIAIGLWKDTPAKQGDGSGYRSKVTAAAMKAGYTNIKWVGSKTSGGSAHDGISMAKIADVTAMGPALVTAAKPNIVIIDIGGYDADADMTTGVQARAEAMIDAITAAAPNAHVVVVGPTPGHTLTSTYTKNAMTVTSALADAVTAKTAAGKNVSFNTLLTAFNNAAVGRMAGLGLLYADGNPAGPAHYDDKGLIPNDNGYGWISEVIWAKVRSQIK